MRFWSLACYLLKMRQINLFYTTTSSSYCYLSKAHDHVAITLPATDKKCPMCPKYSLPRGVPAVQFYNRSPSVTDNIEFCQSYMIALSSRTSAYILVQWSPLL